MNARHLWGKPEQECVFRLVDVIIRHYSVGMSMQNTISCFLSSILALSYSLRQVSIASCCSAVLHVYVCLVLSVRQAYSFVSLNCPKSVLFSPSGKHSFVLLSCPSSVLFCSSGKPSFLLLSCFSRSIKLGALCEDVKLVYIKTVHTVHVSQTF